MKRLDNLHNRLWFNKLVYDENGTYKNSKVIEFYGDYWHCNPKLYDNEFVNKAGYSVKSRAQKDAIRNKTHTYIL